MPGPLVVIIPTHGRPTLLQRTLESVARCDRSPGYEGCIVVENGAPAGAEPIVKALAQAHPAVGFRYLHHPRANKSAALNAALADVADDALCVFFDDDVRLDPGVLEAYAEAAEGHPERTYFGGPFQIDYEVEPAEWVRSLLPVSARGWSGGEGVHRGYFLGCNWAAPVSDLRAAGGFNPNVGPGSPTGATGQETTMQSCLLAAGCEPQFVPKALVWHYVPADRCSVAWAVERKGKDGTREGRSARARGDIWYAARSAGRALRFALTAVHKGARGDDEWMWRARAWANYHLGVLRGFVQSPRRVKRHMGT